MYMYVCTYITTSEKEEVNILHHSMVESNIAVCMCKNDYLTL